MLAAKKHLRIRTTTHSLQLLKFYTIFRCHRCWKSVLFRKYLALFVSKKCIKNRYYWNGITKKCRCRFTYACWIFSYVEYNSITGYLNSDARKSNRTPWHCHYKYTINTCSIKSITYILWQDVYHPSLLVL